MAEFNSKMYRGFEICKTRCEWMVRIPDEHGREEPIYGDYKALLETVDDYLDM